jgi:branched-chain amino acid transport system substrate-binding protein
MAQRAHCDPLQSSSRRLTTLLRGALIAVASCVAVAAPAPAAEPVTGVTDTEILIGTITDLSGVTAIQGVNSASAIRLAFDDANTRGGIHGRKIRYIVEDSQYQVPRAVQAMNKLLNSDRVFFTIEDGGTPMNNATWPMAIEKGTPKLLPLSPARSMYEPFHRLKFSQYASAVDQVRAGVKYFVEQRGRKSVCLMYQDTDFGKESLIGVNLQTDAMGMKLLASTAHKPTDTDFSANVAKLREANCDLVVLGTIVRDTILIISTARKLGWNVDMMGQIAAYDTAIAEAPGGVGEGFYAMTPSMYAYPDDPRPEVREVMQRYKARYGVELNYLGECGYTSAQIALEALQRAGRDLTVDSLLHAMETITDFHDLFGGSYTFTPTNHHGATQAFLAAVHNGRWVPVLDHALAY